MIFEQKRDHPRIRAVLVKGLEHVEHDHVRPEIGFALESGFKRARAKPAVRFLARQDAVDPLARLAHDLLILQNVTEIAKALEPVGQFFPTTVALAIRGSPGIAVELAPLRDLRQSTDHTLSFQFKLMPKPALRG